LCSGKSRARILASPKDGGREVWKMDKYLGAFLRALRDIDHQLGLVGDGKVDDRTALLAIAGIILRPEVRDAEAFAVRAVAR